MPSPFPMTFLPARERWLATVSLLLGMVSFTIAIMVANVILPQLMTSLRADLDQAQGVLTGSGIAQTVVMPMVGWLSSIIILFAIGTVALLLFFLIKWRSAAPLIDLRLFRHSQFTLASLVVLLSTAAFRGTGVLTIVFAQQVLDLTPLDVGWLRLASNVVYGVAVIVAGHLADRVPPNTLTIAGLGAAIAVTIYEQRYLALAQRFAENNDLNTLGLQDACTTGRNLLAAAGETVTNLTTQTTVLIQQRLLAEAATTAYQGFFLLAALVSLVAILPAIPFQHTTLTTISILELK